MSKICQITGKKSVVLTSQNKETFRCQLVH